MNKKVIYIIALSTMVFNACTKTPNSIQGESDVVVVESFLQPDEDVSVKLSKMIPFIEEEYTGDRTVDTANVYIHHQGVDYLLTPSQSEPGKYISADSNLKTIVDGSYSLSFIYNGDEVTASTSIPSKPSNTVISSPNLYIDPTIVGPGSATNPITVSWGNPENSYHLIVVEYTEPSYSPINENLSEESFENFKKVSTEPVLSNSLDLDTRQHLLFFGTYRIITYKVNTEYVNLYENISQNTLNLTEPLTNVKNGQGIFTGMSSDTLWLEVVKL